MVDGDSCRSLVRGRLCYCRSHPWAAKINRFRWKTAKQSSSEALARLAEANHLLTEQKPQEALRRIRAAFVGLVADTRNQVTEGLTPSDVDHALVEASVSEIDRSSVQSLLESIEKR